MLFKTKRTKFIGYLIGIIISLLYFILGLLEIITFNIPLNMIVLAFALIFCFEYNKFEKNK